MTFNLHADSADLAVATLLAQRWGMCRDFVKQIVVFSRAMQFDKSILATGLIYLKRLEKRVKNLNCTSEARWQYFCVAMVLASKYLLDNPYTNQEYAFHANMSLKEMNKLEPSMLNALDFRLYVSASELAAESDNISAEANSLRAIADFTLTYKCKKMEMSNKNKSQKQQRRRPFAPIQLQQQQRPNLSKTSIPRHRKIFPSSDGVPCTQNTTLVMPTSSNIFTNANNIMLPFPSLPLPLYCGSGAFHSSNLLQLQGQNVDAILKGFENDVYSSNNVLNAGLFASNDAYTNPIVNAFSWQFMPQAFPFQMRS